VATLNSKRGEILTLDGGLLAATVEPVTVTVTPSKLQDVNMSIIKIADLLEMPTSEVQKKVDSAYNDLALIKQFYPEELSGFIKEQLLLIPGVSISRGSSFGTLRQYPNSSLMAHTLGYLGLANEPDLEYIKSNWPDSAYKYNTDSLVGKLGLERMYEDKLCGTDGKMIYISTAEQYNRRTLYTEPAQDGLDLILTVDYDLQQRVEELLSLVLYGDNTSGAVIVMDPNTGAVKAMASYPSYDLNAFLGGISEEGYNALLNQKNKPLFNRATQGLYPPGSSFKPFTAALVLDKGLIDPDWVFDGKIVDDYWTPENYGTWVGQPIKRAAMNNRTEPLNMFNAVLNSDNIYFANAALKAGADEFSNYAQRIGLGEAIPFDIVVAKSQLMNEGTRMTLEMLADSGYGQGEMLITPLQMAATFSAFANGGNIPVPYLIESMNRQEATDYSAVYTAEPAVWKSGVVTKAAIARIEPMLKGVVDPELNGTGSRLKVTSCTVAGKTGTAQVGNDKSREISWFIGYRTGVPQEAARLVLVALEVPATSEYSTLKFDIARQLLKMSAE
jgi:cell division protein FtsI/penicillin-binding protein 2